MTSGKNKLVKEYFGIAFSVGLAVVFIFFAFRGVNYNELLNSLKNISLFWFVVLLVSTMFSHWLRALRWKLMLKSIKKDITVSHTFASVMIGYGINNIVPRFGEVSRAVFLGQFEGISRISVLGSIVVERIMDTIFFGLAVVISGYIYAANLDSKFGWLKLSVLIGAIGVAVLVIFLLLLIKKEQYIVPKLSRILEKLSPKFASKIEALLSKLVSGFKCFSTFQDFAISVVLGVLIMLNYALSTLIGFYMLGIPSEFVVNYGVAWVTMSISAIGVMIPTPGGLGSYHTITKSVLHDMYNLSNSYGISYALVTHGIGYFFNILIAAGYLIAFRKKYGGLKLTKMFSEAEEEI